MLTPDELLAAIEAKIGHPATVHEILRGLKLPGSQRATLRRRLAKLVERGELIKIRGNRYGLPERMHLLTGRVQVHPKGFGFVKAEDSSNETEKDLYIAGSNLNQAMHGDRVVARVERSNLSRAEGRIVRVLGQIEAEGVDTQLILKKYGIPDAHEQDAVKEAARLGDQVRPRDRRGRTDFRDL